MITTILRFFGYVRQPPKESVELLVRVREICRQNNAPPIVDISLKSIEELLRSMRL